MSYLNIVYVVPSVPPSNSDISCRVPFAQRKSIPVIPILRFADDVLCNPTQRVRGGEKVQRRLLG